MRVRVRVRIRVRVRVGLGLRLGLGGGRREGRRGGRREEGGGRRGQCCSWGEGNVLSEWGGGVLVGVFPHGTGPCLACATPKQGARVCSKGGALGG